jgi:hypothetical protein
MSDRSALSSAERNTKVRAFHSTGCLSLSREFKHYRRVPLIVAERLAARKSVIVGQIRYRPFRA